MRFASLSPHILRMSLHLASGTWRSFSYFHNHSCLSLLPYHCAHFTRYQGYTQNALRQAWRILRGLECKSRNPRDTLSNRQVQLWSTKWNRTKANRVLSQKCTGRRKHTLPTTQEKTLYMNITKSSILKSDWLYSMLPNMEKLYIVSKNKTGSWLWLRSWTLYCRIQT